MDIKGLNDLIQGLTLPLDSYQLQKLRNASHQLAGNEGDAPVYGSVERTFEQRDPSELSGVARAQAEAAAAANANGPATGTASTGSTQVSNTGTNEAGQKVMGLDNKSTTTPPAQTGGANPLPKIGETKVIP